MMTLQAAKLNLLQAIIDTTDESLIKDLQAVIESRDFDWFDELSGEQQQDVSAGIAQLDEGGSFSHEEAKKRFGVA